MINSHVFMNAPIVLCFRISKYEKTLLLTDFQSVGIIPDDAAMAGNFAAHFG